jgi:Fe-S-cluster-containing dehydrogenase component
LIKTRQLDLDRARLHVDRGRFEGRFVPKICHRGPIPYGLNACPVDAIRISEKNGTVIITGEPLDLERDI